LTLKALGVENVLAFDLMDVPSVDALSHGLELLYALGAINDKTNLTKLGMDMSTFPTEPAVARMLLESLSAGCSWEVLGVAAALQVRALFHKPRGRRQQQLLDYEAAVSSLADPSGDHVTYANLLAEAEDRALDEEECKENFINYIALKRALEVRNQLARFLRQFGRVQAIGITGDESRSKAIRRCVTAGFFFNVAKLANDGHY
jgi:HrpA-like RNA helicase